MNTTPTYEDNTPLSPAEYETVQRFETANLHSIELRFENGYTRSRFKCAGDESSPCHQYPECVCEDGWDPTAGPKDEDGEPEGDTCSHGTVANPACWMQDWFDSVEPDELHDSSTSTVSIPITAGWNGDGVEWSVAKTTEGPSA